jgi:hypothetical protein
MQVSVLVLATTTGLYLATLLALFLHPYVALAVSVSAGVCTVLVLPELRRIVLGGRDLAALVVGLALVLWTRPPILSAIDWDVVSYGLMKYQEMKRGIVGPYFSYGHVYEFIVSYINELFPPVAGLAIGHSLSLVFLMVAVVSCAAAFRSIAGLVVGLALLFFDPTDALAYTKAGKNDVILAAVILLVWARAIERRVGSFDIVVTNTLGALAVGIKPSAVLAVALPLGWCWLDARAHARPRVLVAVTSVSLLFCWQYLANLAVLGSPADPRLSRVGMAFSPVGVVVNSLVAPSSIPGRFIIDRFAPAIVLIILSLVLLFGVGIVRAAGGGVLTVLASALLFVLLCPFVMQGNAAQAPQLRLILPALLLLGIAGGAMAEHA